MCAFVQNGIRCESVDHVACLGKENSPGVSISTSLLLQTHNKRHWYISLLLQIRPSDKYALRKKAAQVQRIVVQDLGFVHSSDSEKKHRTFYLYIVNKRIVGMAVAEIIDRAYPLSHNTNGSNDDDTHNGQQRRQHCCSTNSLERSSHAQKAMLGIFLLWVHAKFRQQGVATRLVTAARERMVFGLVVPVEQTAFSSPTEAGLCFARRYVAPDAGAGAGELEDNDDNNQTTTNSVLVYDDRQY